MNKLLCVICFIILSSQTLISHTREMMMQVVDGSGNPINLDVYLYKNNGNYYELYRSGSSLSAPWKWTAPNANVACDIDDSSTVDPTWPPIVHGAYLLRCENKYIYIQIPLNDSGADFNIEYKNGIFTVFYNLRNIGYSTTQDWDKLTVSVNQFKADGTTSVGTVAMGNDLFLSTRYNAPFNFYVNNNNSTYLFDADKNIYDSQKYYQWDADLDVTNFHLYQVNSNYHSFNSHFLTTYSGVIIQNNLLDDPALGLSGITNVGFSDPWLTDYSDANYGNIKRSQGMSAPLKSRISPFTPDLSTNYNGDIYKGIFLNRIIQTGYPYYQVSFPSNQHISINGVNQNLYFQNWTVNSGAYVQNSSANPSPVVFSSTSGTVTANLKATQISSTTSAFSSSSQRKVLSTYSTPENLFQVYESLGSIWMEKSTDNGTSWTLYPNNGPLVSGSATSPSMDHYLGGSGYDYIFVTYISGGSVRGCVVQSGVTPNITDFYVGNASASVTNPVVSCTSNNKVLFVWNGTTFDNQPGLIYQLGTFSNSPLGVTFVFEDGRHMVNTNANSINPTIESLKSTTKPYLA